MQDRKGNFVSSSKMKVTATETERKVEFEIPQEEAENVTAGLLKTNHLKGMYYNYCILNQEFLTYVVSCNLTAAQSKLLFFLMSEMDKENKVLLNNDLLMKKLNSGEKTIITAIKKLQDLKIIVRQKLGVQRYEYQINYDILNPQLAFKNKASRENVMKHKGLISEQSPYIRQINIYNEVELINSNTGEVFETQKLLK